MTERRRLTAPARTEKYLAIKARDGGAFLFEKRLLK